jgi:glycosyltransferase involved in cell wall biosynthesis
MTAILQEPVVSVIIPVHETPPEFLSEAITSVRAQTELRWELVIVLDAASGACMRVARDMARIDARITVTGFGEDRPRGHSASRNVGVSHARAPLVAFLDADDMFEPHHLTERLALLDAHPDAVMAYGSTLYWHSWNPDARLADSVPVLGITTGVSHAPPTLVPAFIDGTAAVPCTCSLVVRRSAINAVGGFDETFRDLYEDQVFYARIALRFPVVADHRVSDRYRQHQGSMTASASRTHEISARLRFLDWLEDEVAAIRPGDDILRSAITRERWKLRHPSLARALRLTRRAVGRMLSVGRHTN